MMKKYISVLLINFLVIAIFNIPISAYNEKNIEKEIKFTSDAKGIVSDADTGKVLKDAIITYTLLKDKKVSKVNVDKDGKFNVQSMELGYYNWYIEVPGYKPSSYLKYPINDGGNTYNFIVKKDKSIEYTFELLKYTNPSDSNEKSDVILNNNTTTNLSSNNEYLIPNSVPRDPPPIPQYVDVYDANSGLTYHSDIENYIAFVVSSEMDPANYEYNSMTTTQKLNMLEAQA
jgi:hypothetical protein